MTMIIETPAATDVLCGKNKTYAKHAGNIIYRGLINATARTYAAIPTKQEKMRITTEIVHQMTHEHNSRFLKCSGGNAWEELSVTAARDKTSHALRFCAAHNNHSNNCAAAAAVKKNVRPTTRCSSRAKKSIRMQHRRTVSSGTNSTAMTTPRRRIIESFPRYSRSSSKKYYGAPEVATSSTVVVVVVNHSSTLSSSSTVKQPLGVRSMNGEDLEALLREPLNWEDVDVDGDGFFL